jgi:hypothetical protein
MEMMDRMRPNVYFCLALLETAHHVELDDPDRAYALSLRALRMARRIGIAWVEGHARAKITWSSRHRDDYRKIVRFQARKAMEILRDREIGNTRMILLGFVAGLYSEIGELDLSERLANEALNNRPVPGSDAGVFACLALVSAYEQSGRYRESLAQLKEVVATTAAHSIGWKLADAMESLTVLLGSVRMYDLAAEAAGVYTALAIQRRPLAQLLAEEPALAAARDDLGEDRWHELVERGAAMPILRVVDLIDEALGRLEEEGTRPQGPGPNLTNL